MVPRLLQEWEGFSAGESAQQMTAASRAWPGLTLLTLADIKTAAWLVENSHLTHLDSITFTTDLHTQSVSTEVETIKRVAGTVSTKSDDQIFIVKGIILTTFYYSTLYSLQVDFHLIRCIKCQRKFSTCCTKWNIMWCVVHMCG